jgi:dihydroorotate dehydrogenase
MTFSASELSRRRNADTPLVRFPRTLEDNYHLSRALFHLHRGAERFARRALLTLQPERANFVALKLLRLAEGLFPISIQDDPRLNIRLFGLNFKNPIGAGPGLDKDAESGSALLKFGFGFAEFGTVTPQPQAGNPLPRVFRLPRDQAIINRFGFNSTGADEVLRRLAIRASQGGIVGVNIGANKGSTDRTFDYVQLIEQFAPVANYITLNVSSPNTPGLRNLQQPAALDDLLTRVLDVRARVAQNAGPTPVLLKIAPDLSLDELDDIVGIARARRVDGMIVGNTTVSRPVSLQDAEIANEQGGLSGRPLFPLSTRMLAETYVRVEGAFPLIGLGGIDSGLAAIKKFRAGASLIQLCSGFVFRGFELVDEIKAELVAELARERREDLSELIGADAAAVTAEPWPR